MNIIKLLASDNFIVLNRTLITKLGLDKAVLLSELASEYNYFSTREELTYDGYFYSTIANVEKNTTFKEVKQRKLLKELQELDLLKVKLEGMPAKRHIRLNEEEIMRIVTE